MSILETWMMTEMFTINTLSILRKTLTILNSLMVQKQIIADRK